MRSNLSGDSPLQLIKNAVLRPGGFSKGHAVVIVIVAYVGKLSGRESCLKDRRAGFTKNGGGRFGYGRECIRCAMYWGCLFSSRS